MSIIFLGLIVLLILSGLFDLITWAFNIPALIVLVLVWLAVMYNSLVSLVNRTKEAWADIEVQLKRRYDLIPNLVETVKGYVAHEEKTFQQVTEARAQALGAQSVPDKAQAENMLTGALKSIFALAEAYPTLRAVESFVKLQEELSDTENKIQAARRFYNGNVRDLNTALQTFPSNIIARLFGFQTQEFFDLEESPASREPIKVSF